MYHPPKKKDTQIFAQICQEHPSPLPRVTIPNCDVPGGVAAETKLQWYGCSLHRAPACRPGNWKHGNLDAFSGDSPGEPSFFNEDVATWTFKGVPSLNPKGG